MITLASRLSRPQPLSLDRVSLFLDLDGTLAPIELRPEDVGPTPPRSAMLRRLGEALSGRLAIVSGRSLASIDAILDGAVPAAAGVHGLERRLANGAILRPEPHPGLNAAKAALEHYAATTPGVLVEDKRLAVTVHYRLAQHAGPEALALASRLARELGLRLQTGDMVAELKTPGADKGDALKAFMAEAPFRDGLPVFVGDDVTDEDGFAAARGVGGFGVLVGPPRETVAQYGLNDVPDVLDWLGQGVESVRR
ncbi:MAG: trehalose-phosphatase [Caulobacteraceae bacterium]